MISPLTLRRRYQRRTDPAGRRPRVLFDSEAHKKVGLPRRQGRSPRRTDSPSRPMATRARDHLLQKNCGRMAKSHSYSASPHEHDTLPPFSADTPGGDGCRSSSPAIPMNDSPTVFLLVEDDDDHAMLVERTLNRGQHQAELTRVPDGDSALKYLRGEREYEGVTLPDVVLLDLNLPLKSGLEILREMKQDSRLKMIPVVVMTSSEAKVDQVAAYENHVNSYLVKPMDFDQYRKMVNDLSEYWGTWNASVRED